MGLRNTLLGGRDSNNFAPMRGVVVNNDDPKKIGRVRVRIYSIHGDDKSGMKDDDLPWAFPCFFNTGYNSGTFIVPEVGATVFLLFENGESSKPIYIGGMYGTGKNNLSYTGNTGGRKRFQRIKTRETPFEAEDLDTKVIYKSPKGSKILINDNDGKESVRVVDALGQLFGMVTPMDASYSENNGHQTTEDMTKKDFDGWEGLLGRALILLKGLTKSKFKIASENGESEVELLADGSMRAQVLLDSEGNGSFKVGTMGIEISGDTMTISGKNLKFSGENINVNAESVNINGIVKINGKSIFNVEGGDGYIDINSGGPKGSYEPLEDILSSNEEEELFK